MGIEVKGSLAIFFMAAWLTGTVITAIVATENFYTIDRLFAARTDAGCNAAVEKLGDNEARTLLRYLSSELNRLYFQVWGIAQIAVGIAVLWCVVALPKASRAKWMVVSMLGITLLFFAVITPQ